MFNQFGMGMMPDGGFYPNQFDPLSMTNFDPNNVNLNNSMNMNNYGVPNNNSQNPNIPNNK